MAAFNIHNKNALRLGDNLSQVSGFSWCYNRPLLCHHVPMKISTMSQNHQPSYSASITADIEAHLKQAIPLKPPVSVFEPMHHMTFSAPPNSAPALCVAACELVGGGRSQAMAAASALHLMHAASFTHEHLPLTDRPKTKPKPAVHHAYGPNIRLLIPDAMVPFGYELLALSDDPDEGTSGRVLQVITELTRLMGPQGIIEAQYREALVSQSDGSQKFDDDIEWIDDMCRKKEGRLHACAAACGAILGGANEEKIEKLRNYGFYLGIIQGYTNRVGRKEKELERVVELRNLALKELESFKGRKVEEISSFLVGF